MLTTKEERIKELKRQMWLEIDQTFVESEKMRNSIPKGTVCFDMSYDKKRRDIILKYRKKILEILNTNE